MGEIARLLASVANEEYRARANLLNFVAAQSRLHILERTQEENRDVHGVGFAQYKPEYARRKKSTLVDLRSKGPSPHMLDNVYVHQDVADQRQVLVRNVGSPSRRAVGLWHQLGVSRSLRGDLPQREWFGVTTEFANDIFARAGVNYVEQVERAFPSGLIRVFGNIELTL